MPVERAIQSRRLHRPSPLPKAHYTIPKRLPSPFGVDELFDWSSSRGPTHSGSSRSTSTERAALRRHYQCHNKPTVRNWVNDQKEHLTSSRKAELPSVPDIISISSSSTRPLFTPSSSPPCSPAPAPTPAPAPIVRETSIILQPLPTPVTSPARATRGLFSTAAPLAADLPSEKFVSSVHYENPRPELPSASSLRKSNSTWRNDLDVTKRDRSRRQAELTEENGRAGDKGKGKAEMSWQGDQDEQDQGDSEDEDESVYESMVDSKAYGEDERNSEQLSETEQEVEEKVQNESESESEQEAETSKDETEVARSSKPRAPVYLDLAARVESFKTKAPSAHELKSNQSPKKPESTEEAGWTGALQGTLLIRKRGNTGDAAPPGKWSFSGDGAARQPVKDRAVGDIHFSPSFSGSECDYWVLHGSPKS